MKITDIKKLFKPGNIMLNGKKILRSIFKFPNFIFIGFIGLIVVILFSITINIYILKYSEKYIIKKIKDVPASYTVLILGAKIYQKGYLSPVLHDRMIKGLELYRNNKVKKFLLSGDHGQKKYDEVNNMKYYLLKKGVPGRNIFLDHAGFNTYDSVIRAKRIFKVNKLIIVTQKFHLSRAIYIARKNGLIAYGYIADRRRYLHMKNFKIREFLARIKTFLEALIRRKPKFLGKTIPITGNSKRSWD